MDNILKNVQGAYVRHFAPNINYVIGLVLQRAIRTQNVNDQKNLVKTFKTWEVLGLFDQALLNNIAERRELRQLVSLETKQCTTDSPFNFFCDSSRRPNF